MIQHENVLFSWFQIFFQFHQIRQNVIFSLFLTESTWFCLNQHENVFSTWFLMIFHNFIKKGKMTYCSDFQQNWPDFVWISWKTCFSHDFWWFFLFPSKKGKSHFFPISGKIDLIFYDSASKQAFLRIFDVFFRVSEKKDKNNVLTIFSRIDLIFSESAWKHAFPTIFDGFSQFLTKSKKWFSHNFQQFWTDFVWISMKTCFSHGFWRFLLFSMKKEKSYFLPIFS